MLVSTNCLPTPVHTGTGPGTGRYRGGMVDEMDDPKSGDEQAQFIWRKKVRGLDKLFLNKEDRKKLKSGRYLHFLVYSWGFRNIDGDDELTGRWEEITDLSRFALRFVINGAHTRTDYACWGHLEGERPFGFGDALWPGQDRDIEHANLSAVPGVTTAINAGQLGWIFTTRVAEILLPKAISQFNAGQSITFGPLTVGPGGISEGGDSLTWDEVGDVRTEESFVNVRKVGTRRAWKKVTQPEVPNDFVLEALVRTILAQRSGG